MSRNTSYLLIITNPSLIILISSPVIKNDMKVNKIEFWLMNNPVRAFIQEKIQIKQFRKSSSLRPDKVVLEIGCGNGTGAALIKKYFSPKEIYAIDIDQRMIDLANKNHSAPFIHFETGDVSQLRFETNQFDAVFDFGVIHHISNWKDCLRELKRVLKPGGELIIEDLSIETFSGLFGWIIRKIFKHPYEQMYTRKDFITYLDTIGFHIVKKEFSNFMIKRFVVIAKR